MGALPRVDTTPAAEGKCQNVFVVFVRKGLQRHRTGCMYVCNDTTVQDGLTLHLYSSSISRHSISLDVTINSAGQQHSLNNAIALPATAHFHQRSCTSASLRTIAESYVLVHKPTPRNAGFCSPGGSTDPPTPPVKIFRGGGGGGRPAPPSPPPALLSLPASTAPCCWEESILGGGGGGSCCCCPTGRRGGGGGARSDVSGPSGDLPAAAAAAAWGFMDGGGVGKRGGPRGGAPGARGIPCGSATGPPGGEDVPGGASGGGGVGSKGALVAGPPPSALGPRGGGGGGGDPPVSSPSMLMSEPWSTQTGCVSPSKMAERRCC